jgi:hypothetical protein
VGLSARIIQISDRLACHIDAIHQPRDRARRHFELRNHDTFVIAQDTWCAPPTQLDRPQAGQDYKLER